MKFHDFSPFYRSGEGIRSKVSGDRLIDNPAVADAQGGSDASFNFDGTDDYVDLPHASIFPVGGQYPSSWTTSLWIKRGRSSHSAVEYLFDNDGDELSILINTNNTIKAEYWATSLQSVTSTNTITDGDWHHVTAVYVFGTDIKLYVDGVLWASGSASGSITAMGGFGTSVGSRWGADYNFEGQISQVRFHNRALSAAEVRAAYNGQAVPYEYVGGKQDELLTDAGMEAWDSSTVLTSWTKGLFGTSSVNQDSSEERSGTYALRFDIDGSSNDAYVYQTPTFVGGKTYRCSFWAKVDDATNNPTVTFTEQFSVAGINTRHTFNLTTSYQQFTVTLVADGSAARTFMIGAFNSTEAANDSIYIDDFSLTQIGCVAEYLPSGINETQWVDTSGNGLHGTTSTATAVNHEVGAITATGVVEVNNGIKFPSTQVASADANTLDDYEEGTWTPVVSDLTNNAVMHGSFNTASYVKIGRSVFLNGFIQVLDKTDPGTSTDVTGGMVLTGLPFVGLGTDEGSGSFSVGYTAHMTISTGQSVGLYKSESVARAWFTLSDSTTGVSTLQGSEITDTFRFIFSGHYLV